MRVLLKFPPLNENLCVRQKAKTEQLWCVHSEMKNGIAWKLQPALNFRQPLNKLNRLENNVNYIWGK